MDVFAWVAEKRGVIAQQRELSIAEVSLRYSLLVCCAHRRTSLDGGRPPQPLLSSQSRPNNEGNGELNGGNMPPTSMPPPIPINILPATPDANYDRFIPDNRTSSDTRCRILEKLATKKGLTHTITTITFHPSTCPNARSPANETAQKRRRGSKNFHAALRPSSYQASSIHSRKRLSSIIHSHDSHSFTESPPPLPPPPLPSNSEQTRKLNSRTKKDNRLLSDLWLMSAATFRRLGKIEQAKGSIQEAEVRDEDNPNVWVQLGLYYTALGHTRHAIDAFHKAMFIDPDDISASVHLCRLYLGAPDMASASHVKRRPPLPDHVDLAAGILSDLTKGAGWDVRRLGIIWRRLWVARRKEGRGRVWRGHSVGGRQGC
ncbi:cargo-transport protein [Salix suchowensis]|nr:cargo-transport protein [Salix suchowensis]